MGVRTACPIHHGSAMAAGHRAPALSLAWPKSGCSGEGAEGSPLDALSPTGWSRATGACSSGCITGPPFLLVSCDFEQDTCGWSSPADPRLHSFAWGWKNGIPLAKYPGPEQDHTLGTRDGRRHPPLPQHPGVAGRTRRRRSPMNVSPAQCVPGGLAPQCPHSLFALEEQPSPKGSEKRSQGCNPQGIALGSLWGSKTHGPGCRTGGHPVLCPYPSRSLCALRHWCAGHWGHHCPAGEPAPACCCRRLPAVLVPHGHPRAPR